MLNIDHFILKKPDTNTNHLELKKVCQTGSLWISHYDNWIDRLKTPANVIPEITTTVSLIQVTQLYFSINYLFFIWK